MYVEFDINNLRTTVLLQRVRIARNAERCSS